MSLSQSHKCVILIIDWSQHMSQSQSQHITGNMRTVGGKVYSHDNSCIYSIENQMGTLLSSPCQLR